MSVKAAGVNIDQKKAFCGSVVLSRIRSYMEFLPIWGLPSLIRNIRPLSLSILAYLIAQDLDSF